VRAATGGIYKKRGGGAMARIGRVTRAHGERHVIQDQVSNGARSVGKRLTKRDIIMLHW